MKIFRPLMPVLAALCAVVAAGCSKHPRQKAAPLLQIATTEAVVDSVAVRISFIGYLRSNFDAVIQPRVTGYLLSKPYDYGMPVRKGQVIFTIEPDQYSAAMLKASAALESARAQELQARNDYERAVPLAAITAISQSQLDQYTADYKAAQAAVNSAEQELRAARLNVEYTEITSPINGIIDRTPAHEGDYVGPGTQFAVLTTVSNLDSVQVDLALPISQYLRYAGKRKSIYENEGLLSDIRLTLADGTEFPHKGIYDYTRKDVSNTSGTLIIVVYFPNPGQTLKSGQFARVNADIGPRIGRVMVPQRSVSQIQNIGAVWVVGDDSVVHYRRVVLGETRDSMWCVESGLAAGERVAVSGAIKLHEGMKVAPAAAASADASADAKQ